MDGYDIGDANLVISPDGKYFQIYFSDWLANGTTHWYPTPDSGPTITVVSVARATMESVLNDAFGDRPRAAAFQKYYAGWNLDQGLGGYSQDLNPNGAYIGNQQVAYNAALKRYQMFINQGVLIAYAESPDGMHWSIPSVRMTSATTPIRRRSTTCPWAWATTHEFWASGSISYIRARQAGLAGTALR
jgi:hypothetical protein